MYGMILDDGINLLRYHIYPFIITKSTKRNILKTNTGEFSI